MDEQGTKSTEGGRTRYKIPKHLVQGFDGHEVSLKVQKLELERFKLQKLKLKVSEK